MCDNKLELSKLNLQEPEFFNLFQALIDFEEYTEYLREESAEFLYFYREYDLLLVEKFVGADKLNSLFGADYGNLLEDWNKLATPKGFILYDVHPRTWFIRGFTIHVKGGILGDFLTLKMAKTRSNVKSRIKGMKSKRYNNTQRELLKDLLMVEHNQETNHVNLELLEVRGKYKWTIISGRGQENSMCYNLLDREDINNSNRHVNLPYSQMTDVDTTTVVLTRNPQKLKENLIFTVNKMVDDEKVICGNLGRKNGENNMCKRKLTSDISEENLQELFCYFKDVYNSEKLTFGELQRIKFLRHNPELKFSEALARLLKNCVENKLYLVIMSVYVVSAVNNNTGLTSDSTLESIPQDIIDFSIKHTDEIVVELINYVNVLEKYGYKVTD